MAAPYNSAVMGGDWMTQFLQQNGLMLDKTGNVIAVPAQGGMVKPLGNTAYAGGSPTFNEAAGGTAIASQPGIDESRLYNGNTGSLNPNAPPIFRRSDFTFNPAAPGQDTESGYKEGAAASWSSPFGGTDNMYINGTDPNSPSVSIKNGKYAGMAYNYGLDPTGKYYIPQGPGQQRQMGTANYGSDVWMPLAMMASAGAGVYGAGAGVVGETGSAVAPVAESGYMGVGSTAGSGAGAGFGAAPGAGSGLFGTGVTAEQAAGGVGAAQQVAPGGGGGSQAPTYTTGSDQNYGATPGGNNASVNNGLWNSISNGDFSQLPSQLGDYLRQNPQLIGSLLGAVGGSLGSNAITGNNSAAAQQASGAYAGQSTALRSIADQVRASGSFNPVGYTNASGGTTWDPTTNSWKTSLSPQAQGESDMWSQLGQGSLARFNNLDPNAIAAQRYGDVQKLLAPGRSQTLESNIGTLMSKGLLGQGVNQGTGQGAVNPLLAAMKGNQDQQDLQLAMASQDYGMNAQNAGLSQLAGLYGQRQGLNTAAANTFNPALSATGQQLNQTNNVNSLWSQLMQGSATAGLNSALPNANLLASQNQRDAGNYGMWANVIRGLFSNPNQ